MNPWTASTIGIVLGLGGSTGLVALVVYGLLPLLAVTEPNTQGIVGTIVLFISAPLLMIAGGVVGYRRASRAPKPK